MARPLTLLHVRHGRPERTAPEPTAHISLADPAHPERPRARPRADVIARDLSR
jgi:hypothetical protein